MPFCRLQRVEVGGGVAVIDVADLVLGAAEVEDALRGRGFARVHVGDDADVAQFFEHRLSPAEVLPAPKGTKRPSGCTTHPGVHSEHAQMDIRLRGFVAVRSGGTGRARIRPHYYQGASNPGMEGRTSSFRWKYRGKGAKSQWKRVKRTCEFPTGAFTSTVRRVCRERTQVPWRCPLSP